MAVDLGLVAVRGVTAVFGFEALPGVGGALTACAVFDVPSALRACAAIARYGLVGGGISAPTPPKPPDDIAYRAKSTCLCALV